MIQDGAFSLIVCLMTLRPLQDLSCGHCNTSYATTEKQHWS